MADTETPQVAAPKGTYTFRSLCNSARLSRGMANVMRVRLGLKRNQLDLPCDKAKFNASLTALGVEGVK
jgi:hypothetical protein